MSSSTMRIAVMGALCVLIVGGGAFADSELLGTKLTPMGADPKAYARAKKKRTMKRAPKKDDGEAMPPLPKKWKAKRKSSAK